jgi:5-methylcytosine-specific restriction endonuclease McrA
MTQFFAQAFRESKFRCTYCCKDLLHDYDTFHTSQEDHLIPSSEGGKNEQSNIVMSCYVCNNLRGNYMPKDIGRPEENRERLIQGIREYVMQRRAERIGKHFAYWTLHQEKKP